MKRTLSPERRRELRRAVVLALFSAGALNTGAALQAADDVEAAEAEEAEQTEEAVDPASLRNWVALSIGGTVVDGDAAAMRRRTGLSDGVYGGISSLHYETDIDDDTLFKIDARGIFGNEDYSLQLDLNRYDLGYVRGGIRSFRSYSDGSGGWWPSGDVWFDDLFDDKLHLDRRE
jgi:hypothetical protein